MVRELQIDDMAELVEELATMPNNYIYRGHADASWRLQSTLERAAGTRFNVDFVEKTEALCLRDFQSKFHLYDTQNERPSTNLEWLALMQHYGVPTRMLDFTTSPFLALFFAIEQFRADSVNPLAVYAIDYSAVMNATFDYVRAHVKDFHESFAEVQLQGRQDEVFERIMSGFTFPILWVTEPSKLNVRIDRQSGSFLLACEKNRSIEAVLREPHYASVDVVKFIISSGLVRSIFGVLRKMNISPTTVYGDLQGLAASLKMTIQMYAK